MWISARDHLPEAGTQAVLLVRGIHPAIGELKWDSRDFCHFWEDPNGGAWDWDDVTHWMPIPPAPEEKK
jgi:hypothetical protein